MIGSRYISTLKERFDVRFHLSENVEIDDYWSLSELKKIIVRDPSCYGFKYSLIGIPIIRISDMKEPFINYSKVARISPTVHSEFKKTHLKPNDILISVRGVSAGKVGIFLGEEEEANISPNIIIVRLKDPLLAPYTTMILLSEIGQRQIQQFKSGAGKPSLTSTMINRIQIPKPTDELLSQINILWENAKTERLKAKSILAKIDSLFYEGFSKFRIEKKLTNKKSVNQLSKRWDPHFHNEGYYSLRDFIDKTSLKKDKLSNITDFQSDSIKLDDKESKVEYIEIGSVNNQTGIIEDTLIDYPDLLPKNTKIELEDGDLLISKVRPYLNSNSIFLKNQDTLTSTASKNAFSVFRTAKFYHKYYLAAFLRSEIGLHQIIMRQSGTSYPTVSDDDIKEIVVLSLDDEKKDLINDLYKEYVEVKVVEEHAKNAILDLIEE